LGLMLLLVIEALRQLRLWRRREGNRGLFLVRAVVVGCLVSSLIPAKEKIAGRGFERARILKQLEAGGDRHLVIVRYRLDHDTGDEWVYNAADIDGARVVWAREMDPASNRILTSYFHGRRVWLAEPDSRPVRLTPYDPSLAPDPPFRFVKLGAAAIPVLRDPAEIKRKILSRVAAEYARPYRLSCDQWGFLFTEVTGVERPEPANGCFPPGNRGRTIDFEEWFAWLEKQR